MHEGPTAIDLPRSDISAIAENFRKKVGCGPGEPLEPVVVKLGGALRCVEGTESLGSMVVEPVSFLVCMPLETTLVHDRFVISHQLGHYVLHYLYQNQRNRRNIEYLSTHCQGGNQADLEANWFAAAFLMPVDLFREKHRQLNKDLVALADFFCVSHEMAKTRAESLNLRS